MSTTHLIDRIERGYRSAFAMSEGDTPRQAPPIARRVLEDLNTLMERPLDELPASFDRQAFASEIRSEMLYILGAR